jgi:hypothetical protein
MSRKIFLAISLIFYVVSIAYPVVQWPTGNGGYAGPEGYYGLILGFLGVICCTPSLCGLSWLANVTLVLTLVTHRLVKLQRIMAGSTLLLAVTFWPIQSISVDDNGPRTDLILGSGFYLWLASFVFLNLYAWTNANATTEPAEKQYLEVKPAAHS